MNQMLIGEGLWATWYQPNLPTSGEDMGLEVDFNHMAKDLINYAYMVKPQ